MNNKAGRRGWEYCTTCGAKVVMAEQSGFKKDTGEAIYLGKCPNDKSDDDHFSWSKILFGQTSRDHYYGGHYNNYGTKEEWESGHIQ